jgi:hypothetical protein
MTEETKPVAENGQWTIGKDDDGRYFVESSDFTHDVRLYLNGDFESGEQRYHYCGEIIRRLNNQPKPESVELVGYWQGKFSDDGGATLYEVPQESCFGHKYPNKPLYTQSTTVQAAVSAALRKAAEVCDVEQRSMMDDYSQGFQDAKNQSYDAILALPNDDSALRELCLRVLDEWELSPTAAHSDIVDCVLGEGK